MFKDACHTGMLASIQQDVRQVRGEQEQLRDTINRCNNTVDQGLLFLDETDREVDHLRRSRTLNPHAAAIVNRRKRRDDDLEGEVFSTHMESDITDMIRRQGYFEEPSHHTDWETYWKRLEKLFQGERILEDRWGKLIPQFLRGRARAHI